MNFEIGDEVKIDTNDQHDGYLGKIISFDHSYACVSLRIGWYDRIVFVPTSDIHIVNHRD